MNTRARRPIHLAACMTLAVTALLLIAAAPASAAAPRWEVLSLAGPTNFNPNLEPSENTYMDLLTNVGDATQSAEAVTMTDTLPPGVTATAVEFLTTKRQLSVGSNLCALAASLVTCTWPGDGSLPLLAPEQELVMVVHVALEPGLEGPLQNSVSVSGGGGAEVSDTVENPVGQSPFPFGFSHFAMQARNADGTPYTQAGGHPYELTSTFAVNTEQRGNIDSVSREVGQFGGIAHPVEQPHDVIAELPPGLIGDPQAVPRCSLADFQSASCPEKTQIGTWWIWLGFTYPKTNGVIFNLQPSHGQVAELGLYTHGLTFLLTPSLRSGGDYGLRATSDALLRQHIEAISLTLWNESAAHAHALYGSDCYESGGEWHGECPDPAPAAPFLTMPTSCSGTTLPLALSADTWLNPGVFTGTESTLPALSGCNQVPFAPTITARPTTNHADSPSGLDVDLKIPQDFVHPEATATADLRDAVVTLPKGLAVNPSSASALQGCSEAQVGYKPGTSAPFEFTPGAAECPDAAKIGSVEVETPLLEKPLPGSVYLAKQGENPFGSLLAIYITINDPETGIVVKLAGHVEPGPDGQLTTTVTENPQLPFEHFRLDFFGGALGTLRTPPTCGAYETTTSLTPWSAPESGPPAEPGDEFQITGSASGSGACPTSAGAQENAPRFHAGTESPAAGAYSPFSLRLVREDGSQELSKIETTLPPGLVGRLAGVGECSEAQLAAAAAPSRSGAEEQASPSCPLSSEVGTVEVGAGAGPTPLYVKGHAYLAGPYKGAPLSLAIITPAVAGPFDLGTVVVRTALYVNPETAQIHAVSDPIPHILQGIPLDVRSVTLKMSRPDFTLNPTNCNELGFTGLATSLLGQGAPLTQRFQVGGCPALKFKPRLKLSLKGKTNRTGHPALKAVLTAKPGEANIHAVQVTLPHSAFLEQAHIRTICTNVQFNANACPAASIYGKATAITPLLDKPLSGPVYLRSSTRQLPDLVADLNGQIHVVLDGHVDSVNARLRNTFEAVPDTPVSKFTLEMQGGKKGLIVNSENLCSKKAKTKALVAFTGQNGKTYNTEPTVANSCKKGSKGGKGKGHHKHHKSHRLGTSHR